MMNITTYRLILAGLGNVGGSFLELLRSQRTLLRDRYQVDFSVVGAAELGGAALDPAGLDVDMLLAARRDGIAVGTLPAVGRPGMTAVAVAQSVEADLLVEATPTNLVDGQPGLDIVRTALRRGMNVVLANKGPLVLAYAELAALSGSAGQPRLRFGACVGGALPTINAGLRDLAGSRIERFEAVLNGTTHSILRMMETGTSYAEALAEAQRRGMAETNPALDVEGWDAAGKLVILANAVLRRPTALADVEISGITQLDAAELREAMRHDQRIVLLCLAERVGEDYRLSVRPTRLPLRHPLARLDGDEMGIFFCTDTAVRLSMASDEPGPQPSAAALLRDVLDIVNDIHLPGRLSSSDV